MKLCALSFSVKAIDSQSGTFRTVGPPAIGSGCRQSDNLWEPVLEPMSGEMRGRAVTVNADLFIKIEERMGPDYPVVTPRGGDSASR